MKKLVFGYKRWHSRLFFLFNLLIPWALFFIAENAGNKGGFLLKRSFMGIEGAKAFGAALVGLYVIFAFLYIQRTFSQVSRLRHYLTAKSASQHYRYLTFGLILLALTLIISLGVVTYAHFYEATGARTRVASGSWKKWVIYGLTVVCLLSSIGCNVFIQMFEAKNYFEIYYYRHKDTDVKEVLEGIDLNAQLKKAATSESAK